MPKRRLGSAPKWNADADGMRWLYLCLCERIFFLRREKATVINIINIEEAHALCNFIFFQYLINSGNAIVLRRKEIIFLSAFPALL